MAYKECRCLSIPKLPTPTTKKIHERPPNQRHGRASCSIGHICGGSVITEAGHHPQVAALVYIAAFALDAGESCASIRAALPQASEAFTADSNGNWWIQQETFRRRLRSGHSEGEGGVYGDLAGANLDRRIHPQNHLTCLEDQAHLVHGGHLTTLNQS